MKIRKQVLKKSKVAFKHGMLTPAYPYTQRRRGQPDKKKPGYSHVVCQVCDGYGYKLVPSGYDSTCVCELSGKGTAFTNKSYKNITSLKRRFYFKDVCELPDFITIDESFRGSENVVSLVVKTSDPDMCYTRFRLIRRRKYKKTFVVYIR